MSNQVDHLIKENERLGQELDRWQLIARDLIGELTIGQVQQEWIFQVQNELDNMSEISNKVRRGN